MIMGSVTSHAQQATNYNLHANIIYRFTKYIDWPAEKKNGHFVIGIIGDSPLFEELRDFVKNKSVGSQDIIVRKVDPSAGVFNCHILFIGEDESGTLKRISGLTTGTSTLIITESAGLAKKGSCINLVITNEHIKLEFNTTNIAKHNLDIATELLQLGVIIK
jgi:hypothetical protein